jgi:hypothetical protein
MPVLPSFVFYLIAGVLGAFCVSIGRSIGQKFIPHFPDMPFMVGSIIAKGRKERTVRIVGRYMHLGIGALWGVVYGTLVDRQMFFLEFSVAQGIIFSIIPWLFLMAVVTPLAGGGFFGFKINNYRWATSLVLKIIYGTALGFLLSIFINKPF